MTSYAIFVNKFVNKNRHEFPGGISNTQRLFAINHNFSRELIISKAYFGYLKSGAGVLSPKL